MIAKRINTLHTVSIISLTVFFSFFCHRGYSQIDSLSLNASQTNIIYYSLANGVVKDIPNDDWHFAFSSKPAVFPSNTLQSTTIRINEAYGVKVFKVPNLRTSDFEFIDTLGYKSWEQLHDSDTSMWMGAFNRNIDLNDIYNYGWGGYSFAAHSVVGEYLYVVELPNNEIKKFAILKNEWDTAFVIKYANIDNSSMQEMTIAKKPYKTKNFAYLNFTTNIVSDREPLASEWDFSYSVHTNEKGEKRVGFLLNNSVQIFNTRFDKTNPCPTITSFDKRMNGFYQQGSNRDTLSSINNVIPVSFIKTQGKIYSFKTYINFALRSFNSLESTVVLFEKNSCSGNATAISDIKEISLDLFPNPTSDMLNIETELNGQSNVAICSMDGSKIYSSTTETGKFTINTSAFPAGMYLVEFRNNSQSKVKKLIIAR